MIFCCCCCRVLDIGNGFRNGIISMSVCLGVFGLFGMCVCVYKYTFFIHILLIWFVSSNHHWTKEKRYFQSISISFNDTCSLPSIDLFCFVWFWMDFFFFIQYIQIEPNVLGYGYFADWIYSFKVLCGIVLLTKLEEKMMMENFSTSNGSTCKIHWCVRLCVCVCVCY